LDAIGPVTFNKAFLSQSMTFEQDSRTFQLQQQTGALVQLEENDQRLGHQFNLNNPDSKDTFLHILGTALESYKGWLSPLLYLACRRYFPAQAAEAKG
jgi:hypothetical protein